MAWSSAPLFSVSVASVDTTTLTTGAVDSTGCDFIIVTTACLNTGGNPGMSDSKGNTWTQVSLQSDGSNRTIAVFICRNPTVGSGHTFGIGQAWATYPSLVATGWTGSVATPTDQISTAQSASATTVTTGALTPTETLELVIAVILSEATEATPFSIDGGFAIPTNGGCTGVVGNAYGCGQAYLVQSSIAAANPTWTQTVSHSCVALAVSFKDSGSAGGSTWGPSLGDRWCRIVQQ